MEEYLRNNPNKTLIGVAWSMYWRLWLVMIGIYITVGLAASFFSWLAEE